jgi:proteasome accessory factor C
MARPSAALRARRLLALLPYLSETGAIPLEDLAMKVGSDVDTVAEDLGVLALCGADQLDPGTFVDVYVEDGRAVVSSALPALERPLKLTPAEARALATALESIGVDPASPLPRRLAEVAAQEPDIDGIARTVRATYAPGGHAAVIAALGAAAMATRAVTIGYHSASRGETTSRVVHPYALHMWRGAWYLLAWCESAAEERTFRIDRITGVKMTDRAFERPASLSRRAEPLPDLGSLPRATVRFAASAPDLNDRVWPGATFEGQDDGSVLASVPYAGTAWIARKVAARLGDAEIVAPAEVRAKVADAARGLLDSLEDRT